MAVGGISCERGINGRGSQLTLRERNEERVGLAASAEYGSGRKCDDDDGHCLSGIRSARSTRSPRYPRCPRGWVLDYCGGSDGAVGGGVSIGAEVIEAMGYGVAWVDFEKRGTEFRAVGLLVRTVGARAVGIRSGYGLRVMGYGPAMFRILSVGDDNAECADSGSGSSRRMGDGGVWDRECGIGRSDLMGDKYATSLPCLAVY